MGPKGLKGMKGEDGAHGPPGPAVRDRHVEWSCRSSHYCLVCVQGDAGPQGMRGDKGHVGAPVSWLEGCMWV